MYAIVEIMGHRTRAGVISDATLGGAAMLRIEHPTAANGEEPVTEYYAPQALFAVRPCTEEQAKAVAERCWYVGPPREALPAAALDALDEDDDYDDDEEPF